MKIKYCDFFSLLNPNDDELIEAAFMTYGFQPNIFEKHILPTIFNVSSEYNDTEESINGNAIKDYFREEIFDKLKQTSVFVLYDASQYSGGMTFPYSCIQIPDCTFHPKLYLNTEGL